MTANYPAATDRVYATVKYWLNDPCSSRHELFTEVAASVLLFY